MNPRYPYWTLETATEVFVALRESPLAAEAAKVETIHNECVSIDHQIAALESRRKLIEKVGKEAIAAYTSAYYQLFLRQVRQKGKEYCDCGNHVVAKVSHQLVYNEHCSGYYLLHVCPKCLADVKAGRLTGDGNMLKLQEMKEVDGVRLRKYGEQWLPLPKRLHDCTGADGAGYVAPELAKKYGLPVQFWPAEFQ